MIEEQGSEVTAGSTKRGEGLLDGRAMTSDPLEMYLADIFTLPPSLAGLPALSTPCGLSADGLPIGIQLVAPSFDEERLCSAAQVVEDACGLVTPPPPAFA